MEPAPPPLPGEFVAQPKASLCARMFNVFATPGDVFDQVRQSPPQVANWLVPLLLSCLVGMVSAFAILSQETIVRQIQEQQARAIEKKLRDLPQEKREEVRAMIERFSSGALAKGVAVVSAGAGTFAWLFVVAFLVWLAARWGLRAPLPYAQVLELCGLSGMINVLGGIVTTLLVIGMGNMFVSIGPSLLIGDFDPRNRMHLALAACNLMTLWYLVTLGIGLARLTGTRTLKATLWVLVPWVVVRAGLIGLGWSSMGS